MQRDLIKMALKKTIKTKFGMDAEYWRVEHVRYLKEDGNIWAVLSVYLNADAAKISTSGFDSVEVNFIPESLNSDWRGLVYAEAKRTVLEGAEDC